jgi:hypothetical protein
MEANIDPPKSETLESYLDYISSFIKKEQITGENPNTLTIAIGVASFEKPNDLIDLIRYHTTLYNPKIPYMMNITLLIDPMFIKKGKIVDEVGKINEYIRIKYKASNEEPGPFTLIDYNEKVPFHYFNDYSSYFFLPFSLSSSYKEGERETNYPAFRNFVLGKKNPKSFSEPCVPSSPVWEKLYDLCKNIPFEKIISYNRAYWESRIPVKRTNNKGVTQSVYYKIRQNFYYDDLCELLWIYFHCEKPVFLLEGFPYGFYHRNTGHLDDMKLIKLNDATVFKKGGKKPSRQRRRKTRKIHKK